MLEDKNRKMKSKFNSEDKLVGKRGSRLEKLFREKVYGGLEIMILSRASRSSRIKNCMRLGC